MGELAAVLWDLDGTLIDSEPYWIAGEYALVEHHGGTWTDEDAHAVVGFDLLDAAREIKRRSGIPLSPAEIVDHLMLEVRDQINAHLPWRPGAIELLAECGAAGVPCALVTMSWRPIADAVAAAVPPGSFAAVVPGDEVAKGKPDPEPYLAAARLLGVDPHDCVAIEDSPTGVAAALAAGCATLGVPHVVDIAPTDGLTLVPSLDGIGLDQLRALIDG
ncbi:MAG: HAD family phosphatase [Actinomycetota bacterium]